MSIQTLLTSSIRIKINTGFAVVIALSIVVVAIGFWQLNRINRLTQTVIPSGTEINTLQEAALALRNLETEIERFIVIGGEDSRERVRRELEDLPNVVASLEGAVPIERQSSVEELAGIFSSMETEVMSILQVGGTEEVVHTNQQIVTVYSSIDTVSTKYQELLIVANEELSANVSAQRDVLASVNREFLILGVAVLVLGVIMAIVLSRSLTRPITALRDAANAIAGGDLSARASIHTEDEIGQLAQSLNNMTDNLLEARRLPDNILRSMRDSLFVIDTKGNITEVNQAGLAQLGYAKEELIGKPINVVINN